MNNLIKSLTLLSIALASNSAFAHPGHAESAGFLSGFLHPITGWDHLFAILLVSFWSAFALKKAWLGPVIFMGGMGFGVTLGIFQYSISWFELGIAISIMGLGILIYLNRQFNSIFALVLISFFGVFHGYAHADALNSGGYRLITAITADLCGLLLATGILHVLGILLSNKIQKLNAMAHKSVGLSAAAIGAVIAFMG